jgi:hypothetical protein
LAFINIKDAPYNGDGTNGVGTDNSSGIQAALNDAAAAGGGVVWIPAGTYRCNTGLTVPNTVVLMGVARNSSKIHYTGATGSAITMGDPNLTGATPVELYGGIRHLGVIGNSSTNTANAFRIVKARAGYFVDLMADTIGTGFLLEGGDNPAVEWNGVHEFHHIFTTQVSNGVYMKGYNSDIRFYSGDILGKGGVAGSRVGIGLRITDRSASCVFSHMNFQAFGTGYSMETINTGSDFISPREENNDIPLVWVNPGAWYTFIGGNGVFRNPVGEQAGGIDAGGNGVSDFWNGWPTTSDKSTITWMPHGRIPRYSAVPATNAAARGTWASVPGSTGVQDQLVIGFKDATDNYLFQDLFALAPDFPQPSDYGFKGWNMPVGVNAAASTPVMATLVPWLFKVQIPRGITLTNLHVNVATAGATLTAGSNLGAIYLSNGTRIATTADQSTNWTTTGFKTMALTVDASQSLTVPGGPGAFIWVCLLAAGTTIPTFTRWSAVNAGWTNGLLTAANAAVGKLAAVTAGSGPPATFTPGTAITLSDPAHWVAVS